MSYILDLPPPRIPVTPQDDVPLLGSGILLLGTGRGGRSNLYHFISDGVHGNRLDKWRLHVLNSIGVLSSPTYFTFTSLSFDREIHRLFCVSGVFCRPHQDSKEMNKVILNKISWKQKKVQTKHFLDPSRISTSWVSGGSVASAVDAGFWSRSAARRSFREYSHANAQYEGLEDFMIPFQRWDFSSSMFAGKHPIFHICGN